MRVEGTDQELKIVIGADIVFVWSRNGANWTMAPEFDIVGEATC